LSPLSYIIRFRSVPGWSKCNVYSAGSPDGAVAAIPFEERVIERSSSFEFLPGKSLRTCSAEDLIVYKAFADRPRDWVDIEGIVVRQGPHLNLDSIETELGPLVAAKESPEILTRLRQILR